ncbi:MAG: helix-turn-helix domain-containing protein, partial [Conexivisphaera sp.]
VHVGVVGVAICENTVSHILRSEGPPGVLARALDESSLDHVRLGPREFLVSARSCTSCGILGRHAALVTNVEFPSANVVRYNLAGLTKARIDLILEELSGSGLPVALKSASPHMPYAYLTGRQREILYEAYVRGYFDADRKVTLTELAGSLSMSPAALDRLLRRGLKKAVHMALFGYY